jgi:Tfp pilus assembly protein PilN
MDRPHQININLLERADRFQAHIIYWGLGMLLAAAVLGWSGYYYAVHSREVTQLQAENAVLKKQISSFEEENVIWTSIQASETEMLVKRQTVETLESQGVSYNELISEIDRAIPPRITMAGVETIGSRVILTGFSSDHSQVARLIEGLKNISRINNVTVFFSTMNEKTNEVKYSIEMNWGAENQ